MQVRVGLSLTVAALESTNLVDDSHTVVEGISLRSLGAQHLLEVQASEREVHQLSELASAVAAQGRAPEREGRMRGAR